MHRSGTAHSGAAERTGGNGLKHVGAQVCVNLHACRCADEPACGGAGASLDPAVIHVPYPCDVDIRDLICLDEVQEELSLGPSVGFARDV